MGPENLHDKLYVHSTQAVLTLDGKPFMTTEAIVSPTSVPARKNWQAPFDGVVSVTGTWDSILGSLREEPPTFDVVVTPLYRPWKLRSKKKRLRKKWDKRYGARTVRLSGVQLTTKQG